jgi:hypothetical protein
MPYLDNMEKYMVRKIHDLSFCAVDHESLKDFNEENLNAALESISKVNDALITAKATLLETASISISQEAKWTGCMRVRNENVNPFEIANLTNSGKSLRSLKYKEGMYSLYGDYDDILTDLLVDSIFLDFQTHKLKIGFGSVI